MIKEETNSLTLINIIASSGCIQLIEPFLYRPGIEMYQSEVIKKTGVPLNKGLKLLKQLTRHGLLTETEKAGSKFYAAPRENPVLKQLKILIIISKLYELSDGYRDKNLELYLFGSAAKGEDTEHSDLDLLILAEDNAAVQDLVEHLRNNFKRVVSPIIYTHAGYANLYNKEKALYESIERYKIKVL